MKVKKEICYHDKWYSEGDTIIFREEPVWFLFWRLPFYRNKRMKVGYIGEDASAALIPKNASSFNELKDRSIVGNVNINIFNNK
jgi:hypothetical protein